MFGVTGGYYGAKLAWWLPAIDASYLLLAFSLTGACGGLVALRWRTPGTWCLGLSALSGYTVALFVFGWELYLQPVILLLGASFLPAWADLVLHDHSAVTDRSPTTDFSRRPIKPPPSQRWLMASEPGPRDFGARLFTALDGIRPRFGTLKDSVQIFGVVTIAITAFNFWLTTYYEPSTRTPVLTLGAEVERVGVRRALPNQQPLVTLRAKLTAKNPSKGRVEVIASTLNVEAVTMSRTADTSSAAYETWLSANLAPVPGDTSGDTPHYRSGGHANRFLKPTAVDGIYATIPLAQGLWFESSEDILTTNVFHLPDGPYDYVGIYYSILVSRNSDIKNTITRRYCVDNGGLLSWRLTMQSVGGPRRLTLSDETARLYGIALTMSKVEFALTSLAGPITAPDLTPTPAPSAAASSTPTPVVAAAPRSTDIVDVDDPDEPTDPVISGEPTQVDAVSRAPSQPTPTSASALASPSAEAPVDPAWRETYRCPQEAGA